MKELAVTSGNLVSLPVAECEMLGKMYYRGGYVPKAWTDELGAEGAQYRVMGLVFEAAQRGISPLLMLQNVDFINGRMSWKSAFVIELITQAGWQSIVYEWTGDPNAKDFWSNDDNGCRFTAVNPATREREAGTKITVGMVKSEGWLSRKGSKWQTMPEQMFKFRAAAFFGRTNCPSVMGGSMYSADELADIPPATIEPVKPIPRAETKEPQALPEKAETVEELPSDITDWLMAEYALKMERIAADKTLDDMAREKEKAHCGEAIEKETELAKKSPEKYRERIKAVNERRHKEFVKSLKGIPSDVYNWLYEKKRKEGFSAQLDDMIARAQAGDYGFYREARSAESSADSDWGMDAAGIDTPFNTLS